MPKMVKFSSTDLLHAIREIPAELISSTEKLILYTLLACLNADNETWHSIESIAKFASLCERTLNRNIKKLEQKGFIKVSRPTHYTHRTTNHYCANVEQIMSYHVTKSPDRESPDMTMSHDFVSPDIEVGRHRVTQSHDLKSGDRLTQSRTKIDIKKERKKDREQEGEQQPLSVFFEPDEPNQKLAAQWGLNLKDECESFVHKFKGDKTQWEFERWLKKGHEYLLKKKHQEQRPEEPQRQRSTVVDIPPIILTPQSEGIRNQHMAAIKKTIGRMIIGKSNGHG